MARPANLRAQDFLFTTNNGALEVQRYTGAGGNAVIPDAVGDLPVGGIGMNAYYSRSSLTSLTIPASVTRLGANAFASCFGLNSMFIAGNAPAMDSSVFWWDDNATIYYLPETTGWGETAGSRPTSLWNPQIRAAAATFGAGTIGFGFGVAGHPDIPLVLEACTNLVAPSWEVQLSGRLTNGLLNFNDPGWTNHPARFYRIRSP